MSNITYDKLSVAGVEYISIESLEIRQCVNCHATAAISMVVEYEKGRNAVDSANEKEVISILADKKAIFCGVIQKAGVNYEKGYCLLKLELISTSILWDLQKKNRSYQVIGTDFGEIILQSTNGQGVIVNYAMPKASESVVVQYQETTWQFMLRMAAYMETAVFVDAASVVPKIKIGVSGEEAKKGQERVSGETGGAGSSEAVIALGSIKGSGIIRYIKSTISKGTLESYYAYARLEDMIPDYNRPSYIGKIFSGIVQSVSQTAIQVWIPELDDSFDKGSNTWFPYSTAYSTSVNGAGIYCMPVKDDPVRVFLPSERLKDIFSSSGSVMRGIVEDKEERCFCTPDGMNILFAKDGLSVSTKTNKAFIKLHKDGSIAIASAKSIYVISKSNIDMQAVNGLVEISAENKIQMVTPYSYVGLGNVHNGNEVYMVSDKIYVGIKGEEGETRRLCGQNTLRNGI